MSRVSIFPSPTINVFYAHHPLKVICDSGATSSLIRYSVVVRCNMPMKPTVHTASQADGTSKMKPMGEISITVTKGCFHFKLEAVVVEDLDCDILGGMPFLKTNCIVLDIPNDKLTVQGKYEIPYTCTETTKQTVPVKSSSIQSYLLKASKPSVVWPDEYVELEAPQDFSDGDIIALEPRMDSNMSSWVQPTVTTVVSSTVRLPNLTDQPVVIKKHQHLVQVHRATTPSLVSHPSSPVRSKSVTPALSSNFSKHVTIDPSNVLSADEQRAFHQLHSRYDNVFNPRIGAYNDVSGRVRAHINMGPVDPPVNKGHLPSYGNQKMVLLQQKMDELEDLGVLARPEDVGIVVEHVSPSFLVKKANGDHRLVTAFNSIAAYAKPVPTKSTSSEEILRFLAQYRYIIKTDMTKQFFQLPMTKSSMKYLGVITPYKGIRVYTRAAMGMPGSTEHLDELTSRIFGDMVEAGKVIKIADDLYAGADSIPNLLDIWEELLMKMEQNNLRLSATKTVICPISTTILGWQWSQGTIAPSPHKLSPLTTAEKPKTVKALRSWCGAYKFLKSCVPSYSILLADLEAATAGKESKEAIVWTKELTAAFSRAQDALKSAKAITIPRPTDQLVITTDGCTNPGGIGAVLFVMRGKISQVGGYFSARLRPHQKKWLPCEVEALAIATAISHWSPYMLNSRKQTQVLTDSRPCVQAYSRLQKGQFSASARISSFLSTVSKYNVTVQHIPGSQNLPADFHSRHPVECTAEACKICAFVKECEDSAVRSVNVLDVEEGRSPMPFLTLSTWKATQQDCPHLRRTYAHLVQGTRPARKASGMKEVRAYLRSCTIGRDGLLVVRKSVPFARSRDMIVVPQHILHGLLSALHLRLSHPSRHQLAKLFHRYYFALGAEQAIADVSSGCAHCAALASLPKEVEDFSTSKTPTKPGEYFAADVMCRARQKILVVRECFSQFTITRVIPDEKSSTLRDSLLECTAELKSPSGCIVRVDGGTGFGSLIKDIFLSKHGINLEQGRIKNRNKNPIAEKAVQELEIEIKRCFPEGGPLSHSHLAMCTATLNARIRNRGLSAREILFQRDDHTGVQLNFSDDVLAHRQFENRQDNHRSSALSQAPKGRHATRADVNVGDLVYIKSDGDKHTAREKYIVVQADWDHILAKKLKGSQFRSKLYKLRYSEVYPVPLPKYVPPVTCQPDRTSDLHVYERPEDLQLYTPACKESVSSLQPTETETIEQWQPDPQIDNVLECEASNDLDAVTSPTTTEDAFDISVPAPVRPKRVTKQPAYLKDYVT